MEKNDLFEKYGIDENDFTKAGLDWNELVAIREDLSIPLDNSKILIIFFCNLHIDR
ncbi:MAG: hypothetical protein ACQEQO_09390 [Thermodesulfobacteriota bacterium]